MANEQEPSASAVIMWTVILMMVAGAAVAFAAVLVFHTALPRRVGAMCLGVATALVLVRWVGQRFEK